MESSFFFDSDGYQLFGVLYIPDESLGSCQSDAYIIFHPFAEEKKSSQKILVDLARSICSEGKIVFMFDLRGCGDSEGEFSEAGISIWLKDVHNAISILKKEASINRIGLIGLRFGGFLAINFAMEYQHIYNLILIEPTLNCKSYLRQTLRKKMIKQLMTDGHISSKRKDLFVKLESETSIDFDGYEITSRFYRDFISFNMKAINIKLCENITIFNIANRKKSTAEYFSFLGKQKNNGSKVLLKTLKMPPFWNRIDMPNYSHLVEEINRLMRIEN